jgi:hypothetical protein
VRNPHVTDEEREKAAEAALAEAHKLLGPPAGPPLSWAVVNWDNPDSNDPRDAFESAVEFVIALLDPGVGRRAADEFLNDLAPIVRKAILPSLRLGLPPKKSRSQSSSRSLLLRDRRIAAVVTIICEQYRLNPTRNEASLGERPCCGCSIVAEALNRLGIKMTEGSVERIYAKYKQA